jgi:NAD(P)-dependent dehydrogenase (short-subunit alcohol dehydrogenase family)
MIRLDNQVAIMTGSGRGLGAAYARLLAEKGLGLYFEMICRETIELIGGRVVERMWVRGDRFSPQHLR